MNIAAHKRICLKCKNHSCWSVLDEYNRQELDKAFDFESTRPLGSFSPAFLKKIALTVKDATAARRLTGVSRS
jgi:hypothetical protein